MPSSAALQLVWSPWPACYYVSGKLPDRVGGWLTPVSEESEPTAPSENLFLDCEKLAPFACQPRSTPAIQAALDLSNRHGLVAESVMTLLWKAK